MHFQGSDNVTARMEPILYHYTDWGYGWDPVNSVWVWSLIPNPNLTMPYMIPAIMEVKVW